MVSIADQLWEDAGQPLCNEMYGVSVVLSHGIDQTEEFTAIWEQVTYDVADSEGFLTQYVSRDFTFAVADCVMGSDAIEPRAGDRITLTENEQECVFEILPIGSTPAVELMPNGLRWKVHTKQVQ